MTRTETAFSNPLERGLRAILLLAALVSLSGPPAHAGDLGPSPQLWAQAAPNTPASPVAATKGPWSKLAPFPHPAEELLGATANGKLYVFAGLGPGWKPLGLVDEYDPATDRWTDKKPMPLPSHHVAFVTYKDAIYAFGGFRYPDPPRRAWVPIDNAWKYEPTTDTWTALAPMPTKRGAAGAAVAGGKIYVIGGAAITPGSKATAIDYATPHQAVGTVEEYDPATNTWRSRSPMPTARNHLAVASVGGKIYAIGGRLGAVFIGLASDTDVVEEYDPAVDMWTGVRARMPTPRSAVAWGVFGNRIYVAGGEFQDARMSAAFKAVEAYDPARNQWSVLPSMPVGRHGVAAGFLGSKFHLVSGDVQSSGSASKSIPPSTMRST